MEHHHNRLLPQFVGRRWRLGPSEPPQDLPRSLRHVHQGLQDGCHLLLRNHGDLHVHRADGVQGICEVCRVLLHGGHGPQRPEGEGMGVWLVTMGYMQLVFLLHVS